MLKGINVQGFTMVELLIAMVISAIVLGAVYSTYRSQQQSYIVQDQIGGMQQNLRAAMYHMARDVRMAGYDPVLSGKFGITDIKLRNMDNVEDVSGNSSIKFTIDKDEDGVLDSNETIYYCIYDYPVASPDGTPDFARRVGGGGRQLLAENIEALGLAYAFDSDNDGELDTSAGSVIWAIDSDNDNVLDINLDTDNDGDIDINDSAEGTSLAANVNTDDIRAAMIWLLARSDREDRDFYDTRTYVVANQRITPNDGIRRRLMTTTVEFRNLGL